MALHTRQVRTSLPPHEPQKLCPVSFSCPHRGHGRRSVTAPPPGSHQYRRWAAAREDAGVAGTRSARDHDAMTPSRVNVREIQTPIRERYKADPHSVRRTLVVKSGESDLTDPLHCSVRPDAVPDVEWRSGAHAAVGGAGDVPCSADLLLAALVACQETTLRMVAANAGIELEELEITAEGDWDPRGTLAMGREFPVGLTGIRCHARVVAEHAPRRRGGGVDVRPACRGGGAAAVTWELRERRRRGSTSSEPRFVAGAALAPIGPESRSGLVL